MSTYEKIQLVLVGDEKCGKSAILSKFIEEQYFLGNHQAYRGDMNTVVVDLEFNKKKVELLIRDANESNYYLINPMDMVLIDVALMCFSVDRPDTLKNLDERWSPRIRDLFPEASTVLVGNKIDLRDKEQVTVEQGKEMAEKLGARSYVECSAMLSKNITEVFEAAIKAAKL